MPLTFNDCIVSFTVGHAAAFLMPLPIGSPDGFFFIDVLDKKVREIEQKSSERNILLFSSIMQSGPEVKG